MASLSDILKNGLPQVLDNVGGLADEVKGISSTIGDIRSNIRGSKDEGADNKPEQAPPVNEQVEVKNVQGPNLSAPETNRTLLIAGGVVVGLLGLALVMRR